MKNGTDHGNGLGQDSALSDAATAVALNSTQPNGLDTMTSTTANAATATAIESTVTDAETKRIELDALEATGLGLITSDGLAMLQRFAYVRNVNFHQGRLDGAAVESSAVRYLAIFLARYGSEDVARLARGAAKKACNLVAASAQNGNRSRGKGPADVADVSMLDTSTATADQVAAVKASVTASHLSPIVRGYAHAKGQNVTDLSTSIEREGYHAALSAALVDELGADTLEALHQAYTPEVRSTRGGSANPVGTVRRNRSIAWADAAPVDTDRGTFRYRVQVAAKAATVAAKNA